ncbi:hypothetical protein B481_0124 [Planococcus halocryophilus Or1]|uniref:Uncharacterized protein n=1 Tax=Planococcus halocryophilus TaxID=1215089 RepID=A0A1C7DMB5_9BACL|nr:hypothetical protein [Planococcus halocryophilus]ANU12542.1 hypothetical protein BBI08_01130 [Planococcus halocryophilus]EMF48289.1 hypothetical protein B481_0124 [Planococcus halocryophilus Or1]
MRFNLLTNGIDSLKASFVSIRKLDELAEGVEHNIKDTLIHLNHANEILFKLMLKNQKEYLMFEDISNYMKAKSVMLQQGKSSVLEINPKLKTVNFSTAINRIELLCDIEVSSEFKGALDYLNKKRNQIMHFEIDLNRDEVNELIEKLKICQNLSIEFFNEHLNGIAMLMHAARFEVTVQDFLSELAHDEAEESYIDFMESAYEDAGEGKW